MEETRLTDHECEPGPVHGTPPLPWYRDAKAREMLFSTFTCFYALMLILLGLMIELSHLLVPHDGDQGADKPLDMVFGVFTYGGSLVFLTHNFWVLLRSYCQNQQDARRSTISSLSNSLVVQPSTGSLYLRLGCVVFGIFGVVYYGASQIKCLIDWVHQKQECNIFALVLSFLATLFIFIQMHFVFCNSKIGVSTWRNRARLGMMHLVATNLWTWMRYVLKEEAATAAEIDRWNDESEHNMNTTECHGADCVLGSLSEFMYTCVVEYSLICAGVAFVFWTNIGKEHCRVQNRRHHFVSIDCSQTTNGLFAGFLFLIVNFICIALFNTYSEMNESSLLLANMVLFTTNALLFALSFAACIYAFYRIRDLNFVDGGQTEDESAELLDRILLVVGLIGELMFIIGNLMALVRGIHLTAMTALLLVVQILRLMQVLTQTALLTLGSKLKAEADQCRRDKPGKQTVTFLIIANVALFMLNTFEAQKADLTHDIVHHYGERRWALLVRGLTPLTIFYRFHSSVCFAQVWEHTFSEDPPMADQIDDAEEERIK